MTRTKALTVRTIAAAPSVETAHKLFRFDTHEAGEVVLAVPSEKLAGLAGLAIAYSKDQDGTTSILAVDAFDVGVMPEGLALSLTQTGDGFGTVTYGLPWEGVAALRDRLNQALARQR